MGYMINICYHVEAPLLYVYREVLKYITQKS